MSKCSAHAHLLHASQALGALRLVSRRVGAARVTPSCVPQDVMVVGLSASELSISLPDTISAVWFEVGVWRRSDFMTAVTRNSSLFLVALEPTPRSARDASALLNRSGAAGRFAMIQRACTETRTPSEQIFYEHGEKV